MRIFVVEEDVEETVLCCVCVRVALYNGMKKVNELGDWSCWWWFQVVSLIV